MNEYEQFLDRVETACDKLTLGLITYSEWSKILTGETLYADETLRRCHLFFDKFLNRLEEYKLNGVNEQDEDRVKELQRLKEEIKAERIKLSDEKREQSTNDRRNARNELFEEKMLAAIDRLEPVRVKRVYTQNYPNKCEGVLCIADAHYGTEINLNSLFGEVVNTYSPEIFKARMNKLLADICSDKDRYFDYTKLTVFDMGDAIQGILRMSDLMKLKVGVIESTMEYAEFISQWLTVLSDELEMPIDYICLGGNHNELRLLGGKKGDFESENMGKVIREFIYLRLKDNPNITVAPYSECGFKNIQGLNILAYHGDDAKNDLQEISFWEQYNQIDIDILLEAHLHHKEEVSIGYALNGGDKEVVHVPSLVGADPFSKKCRKLARAGAKFMVLEDGAKTWEKIYYLN